MGEISPDRDQYYNLLLWEETLTCPVPCVFRHPIYKHSIELKWILLLVKSQGIDKFVNLKTCLSFRLRFGRHKVIDSVTVK